MESRFSRTERVYGPATAEKLAARRVAVFGLGGVGGYAVEALARSGIGTLDLVDHDIISLSNFNRQILATSRTLWQYKADAARERVLDINPDCAVTAYREFFLPETAGKWDFTQYDYIVDCVDTVTAKLRLIEKAREAGVPIISAMGTGNKKDPGLLRVSDLYETSVCPLARIMRKECRKRGIVKLKVVWSPEEPAEPYDDPEDGLDPSVPGSTAFVPAVAGLLMAAEVVNSFLL